MSIPYFLLFAPLQEEGLGLADVLESLPTDPASIFVLLLVVAAGVAVWLGGRPKV